MKKAIYLLSFILSLGAVASAQVLSTSATITDSDGQAWVGGTYSIVINGSGFFYNGTPIPTTPITGTLDSTGSWSGVSLYNTGTLTPINAQYKFTLCSNTSASCSSVLMPVTGTNLSSALSALVTAPRFSAGPSAYGYADGEVLKTVSTGQTYFNVLTQSSRQWNGSSWVPSSVVATTQPYTDSSTNIATTKFVSNTVGYVPPSGTTIYYIDFGDSRLAGSALQTGDAPSDFIQSMSHFSGAKIVVVKLGYPGETSCQIYANYSTTAHAYAVNGTTRTVVFIHNAMGVNDILLGNSVSSAFGCIQQIVTAEKADGMTVLQDTIYKVGTAPRPTATGGITFTPTWYPSAPDASCITPVQGWTAYSPAFNQQLSLLNMNILFGTYTTPPDKILDWGSQVKDMWDVQYTCEGVHTTALLNKAWAQYVNNSFGIGTSTQDGDGYYRSVDNFDALYVGTREVINNYGDGYLESLNVDGFPATGFPDHGTLFGWQSNVSYVDSIGNGPSIIGTFCFRQAVESEGANFDSWCSDDAGNWTAYGALNWGDAGTGAVIPSSSNVCQTSGTNCPALNTVVTGNITLTTATSNAITITGVTTSSKCSFTATNSTAAGITSTLAGFYAVTANTFTLNHAATLAAGATYGVVCSLN